MIRFFSCIIAIFFVSLLIANNKNIYKKYQEAEQKQMISMANEYIAIVRHQNSKNHKEILKKLDKIAKQNNFATLYLFYVYSRGLYGQKINYHKANEYLNYNLSIINIFWELNYKLVAELPQKNNYIFKYPGFFDHSKWVYQKLKKTEQFPDCFAEREQNFDDIRLRVLNLVKFYTFHTSYFKTYFEAEKEFGKVVDTSSLNFKNITPLTYSLKDKEFNLFKEYIKENKRAYVMFAVALEMANINSKYHDAKKARNLFLEIKEILRQYPNCKCHEKKELENNIDKVLSIVIDLNQNTDTLLKILLDISRRYNPIKKYIITQELIKRTDSIECDFLRVTAQKDLYIHKENEEKILQLARKGSLFAISHLFNTSQNWETFYLAGKYNFNFQKKYSSKYYFEKSLWHINRGYKVNGNLVVYKEKLRVLGKVFPKAKERYEKLFSHEENIENLISYSVSHKEYFSSAWDVDKKGNKRFIVIIKPYNDIKYIDIKFAEITTNKEMEVQYNCIGLEDNKLLVVRAVPTSKYQYFSTSGKVPYKKSLRMRFLLHPTEKVVKIIIKLTPKGLS